MIDDYYLLLEFTPARLQDLVLWLEPASFRGNTWYNLAPRFSDRNHGTAYGVGLSTWHPQFPPGPIFYGDDEYAEIPDDDSLDITDAITVETWVNPYSLSYDGSVNSIIDQVDNTTGWSLYFYDGYSCAAVRAESGTSISENEIDASGWINQRNHIVFTYHETEGLKIYKDGSLIKEKGANGKINPSDRNICIGRRVYYNPSNSFFNGLIPLVRIYKAALTPAEIVHNYTHHPLYFLQRGLTLTNLLEEGSSTPYK